MKKLLFFLLLAVVGCIDEVKIEDPALPESAILVDGKMLHGGAETTVTLRTFELYAYDRNLPRAISARTAELVDDAGRRAAIFASGDGTYTQIFKNDAPAMPIETGRSYRIELNFYDGRRFVSAWEKLAAAPKIDSLEFDVVERDEYDLIGNLIQKPHVRFKINTKLPPAGANVRWQLEQCYRLTDNLMATCYPFSPVLESELSVLSTAKNQAELRQFELTETRVNYRFAEGYYFIVYQQAISDEAYGFFEELNQLLAKKGTLFDPPAGAIRSNVVCENDPETVVHGLFYAFSQDTARVLVRPADVGNPGKYCPLPPSMGEAPRKSSCDDCRCESRRSDFLKPEWFQF